MKRTIKAEMERNVIQTELLNENSLLVISNYEKNQHPTVSVCYIEDGSIKEARVATLTSEVLIHHNERMVAAFIPRENGAESDLLITVFDLNYHRYVENDFLQTVYDMYTTEGVKTKQLTLHSDM